MDKELEALYQHALKKGSDVVVEDSMSSDKQIVFQHNSIRLFGIVKRSHQWFIWIFRSLFLLQNSQDVYRLCDFLSTHYFSESEEKLLGQINSSFQLVPCDLKDWVAEGQLRNRQLLEDCGWHLVPEGDNANLWNTFTSKYNFHPSTVSSEWPSISEPEDSVTHSVATLFDLYDNRRTKFDEVEMSLRQSLLTDIQKSLLPDEPMYALFLNHDGYRFVSHDMLNSSFLEMLPGNVTPIGNYHLFVTSDVQMGVLGHPWEKTICFFGRRLLDNLSQDTINSLDKLVRRSGNQFSH